MLIPKDFKHNRIKDTRKRAMNAEEKAHADNVASMGCLVCGQPAEVHHEPDGAGARRNHKMIVPLCPMHHRDNKHGRHGLGREGFEQTYGINLRDVAKQLWRDRDDIYS